MKVRTKLGLAIAAPTVALGGALLFHMHTTRRAVDAVAEVISVWSLAHQIAIEQAGRVTQMDDVAAKYLVTRDAGYLTRLRELRASYAAALAHLDALPLDGRARESVDHVAIGWLGFASLPDRLAERGGIGAGVAESALQNEITSAIADLRARSEAAIATTYAGMEARLSAAELSAADAERAALFATLGALLLSGLIGVLVVRAIANPISRLAAGTLEISEGRLGHRVQGDSDDEFAQVMRGFNRMAARLEDIDQVKRDFVAAVSHDLKTPLASMEETIELMRTGMPGPLTSQQERLLTLHQESASRLRRMLGQLLDLSRLDSLTTPEMHRLDFAEQVRGAVLQAVPTQAAGRERIRLDFADQPLTLQGDPDRLRRVVDNLLDNALKFAPPDSPVTVGLQAVEDRPAELPRYRWAQVARDGSPGALVWLRVADQGPGIPDDQKDLIFSRFHRAGHPEQSRGRGVGLGLAICREICHAHDGVIWVEDNPEGGSIFHVLLPGVSSARRERLEVTTLAERREVA